MVAHAANVSYPLGDGPCRVKEQGQRAAVVAEARRWVGTPWRHRAKVFGAGVDCAQLLIGVYSRAGVIADFDPGDYPPDWHCHRDDERFVGFVTRFAEEYAWRDDAPRPGDCVLWKFGRAFAHGGIVSDWPRVVHAFVAYQAVDETDTSGTELATRDMRAFSFWPR